MTHQDDERPVPGDGVAEPAADGRARTRRLQITAGAVGIAAVLGAWAMTAQRTDSGHTAVQHDPGAIAPIVPATSPAPSASSASTPSAPVTTATSTAVTKAAVKRSPRPKPAATDSAKVRKKIQAARAAAARDGQPLQRPRETRAGIAAQGAVTRTQQTSEGTVRITTAEGDLSGQRERLMAADEGRSVGNAQCTSKVRFSEDAAPKEIPTMLLCWRISAARSVVTLAVVKKGKPSAAASAALIDREWAKLR